MVVYISSKLGPKSKRCLSTVILQSSLSNAGSLQRGRYVYTAFVHSGVSVLFTIFFLFFLQCNKMQGAALLFIAGLVVMASAYGIRPRPVHMANAYGIRPRPYKNDGEEYPINNCSPRKINILPTNGGSLVVTLRLSS